MTKMLLRFGLPSILLLALAVVAIANPLFHYANASVDSSGNLNVSFKETGLGGEGFSTVNITASANASATYQCWNNGGKHPKAGNKETVTAPVSGGGEFPVRNGQTTGSITVSAPGPGDFSCPSGQSLYLQSVTYSGIKVTDETSGASLDATPDSVSSPAIHILIE
jgi:hypothetical protein